MKYNLKFFRSHLFFTLICFLLVSFFLITPVLSFGPSSSPIYQGIDVSSWQGSINFSQVKNSGIDFVYIKSSEGRSYIDPFFEVNYQNAKANGLKIGFYHYVTARNTEEAEIQANFFASVIRGKEIDCKLAMDFESFGDLSVEQINEISRVFLSTLERITNSQCVIYSNSYDARAIFSSELTSYPLWVANYGVSAPESNGKWETWVGWQYTSTGRIAGISSYVDRNQFTDGILLSSTNSIPQEAGRDDYSSADKTIYTVKSGDTLTYIAEAYHTTVEQIVQQNPSITNPNLIYPGQELVIYQNSSAPENSGMNSSGKTLYRIQYGDTLSEISLEFNCSINTIATLNGISNPDLIYAGALLRIPNCN